MGNHPSAGDVCVRKSRWQMQPFQLLGDGSKPAVLLTVRHTPMAAAAFGRSHLRSAQQLLLTVQPQVA